MFYNWFPYDHSNLSSPRSILHNGPGVFFLKYKPNNTIPLEIQWSPRLKKNSKLFIMVPKHFKIWPHPLHCVYSGIQSSEWTRVPQTQSTQIYPKSMLFHLPRMALLILSPVKVYSTFLVQGKCHIILESCPDLLRQSQYLPTNVYRERH